MEQPHRKTKTLLHRRNYQDENEKTGKRKIEKNPFLILYMDRSYDISFDFFSQKTENILLSTDNDGKLTFPSVPRM